MSGEAAPTLEEAYRDHYKLVFGVCFNLLRDKDAAEDATADVFCHLAKRLHMFHGRCRFSTWLHRVAFNLTLMKARRRRPTQSLEGMLADRETHGAVLSAALATRDRRLETTAERLAVASAMEALTPRQARLLDMVYMQGWSMTDAAEATGASLNSLKSRTYQARRRFREAYAPPGRRP